MPFTCDDRIIRVASDRIVYFADSMASGIRTLCMRNNERQIAYLYRLKYYCFIMSGKRKKDDSEAVGIMKFKSTERNRISSKEPSDIEVLTGKIETNVES